MERGRPAAVISFFTDAELRAGIELALHEDAVAHARARRVEAGAPARLLDGRGTVATAEIAAVEKRRLLVRVSRVDHVERPSPLEVLVPVADKDRMLVAAEKCAELQVTAWRPTYFARSRSVSPRGEGDRFRDKVLARMRSALEQSGGAWLPAVAPEQEFADAVIAAEAPTRLILDSQGTSIGPHISSHGIAFAVGPEGGFEPAELAAAASHGWSRVALGPTTLRFETAVIAAAATIRALQIGR